MIKLSIVIPVFNDEEVLEELYGRLKPVANSLAERHEIIFVDDGSKDRSYSILREMQKADTRLRVVKLARNYGQANSIVAGLDQARGEIIVLMDSDLQDRPEDVPLLVNTLHENEDAAMAIAKWISRDDSRFKKAVSKFFYTVSERITNIHHAPNLGVFRAIRKSALDQVKDIPEKTGTILSLLYWSGLEYIPIELKRDPRFAGTSGYSLKKMLRLTSDRVFSYSLFPIRLASIFGVSLGLVSFILGIALIIRKMFFNVAPGWTSIIVLVLLLFGINFIFMGVIGEYLGRIYLEAKDRPKYIISNIIESGGGSSD